MKLISPSNWRALLIPALLILTRPLASAQQPAPPQGAIRFANASSLPEKVLVTIDGGKLRPDGFNSGDTTGTIGILAGAHRLGATSPSAKAADSPLTIQPNTSTTIVGYSFAVEDPQTKKPVEQLKFYAEVEPAREKGKHFRLLYASAKPAADLTVNGQPLKLAALRSVNLPAAAHDTVKLETGGKAFFDFTAAESGSFLVVIFDKADGSLAAVTLPDYG